ncbi:hypothetical protein IVG45_03275 [Methylomonas sp. LL1]|uniref:hypothetical protein n=1 Tax=Methylomonas sp. LL1 TaxID=2785785 RepID=UPI0018C38A86|nr:hypothetical protein [Methylomonas sp. LL1]QPK64013.1 hypothetical protein IVG45_03275 [Methylomonas sp. LL1]
MQQITIDQLADILLAATIISTTNHAGMLAHEINHPTIGKAATIQGDNGAFLIRG